MSELFEEIKQEPARAPNLYELAARKKLCLSDEYEVWQWEAAGCGDSLISIGKTRLIERGQRKGKRTWRDKNGKMIDSHRCVISRAELEQAKVEYEESTGNCHNCGGSGKEWAGWSATEGNSYRECSCCHGKGTPRAAIAKALGEAQ